MRNHSQNLDLKNHQLNLNEDPETQPYALFGVNKETPLEDCKKLYRHFSKLYHPDKPGGNTAVFQKLSTAINKITDDKTYFTDPGENLKLKNFFVVIQNFLREEENFINIQLNVLQKAPQEATDNNISIVNIDTKSKLDKLKPLIPKLNKIKGADT